MGARSGGGSPGARPPPWPTCHAPSSLAHINLRMPNALRLLRATSPVPLVPGWQMHPSCCISPHASGKGQRPGKTPGLSGANCRAPSSVAGMLHGNTAQKPTPKEGGPQVRRSSHNWPLQTPANPFGAANCFHCQTLLQTGRWLHCAPFRQEDVKSMNAPMRGHRCIGRAARAAPRSDVAYGYGRC